MAGNNSTIYPDMLTNSSLYPVNTESEPICNIPREEPEENIYLKVARYLWLIGPPIITVTGVVGNTLTVLILMRQLGRWSSTAVFLFVLAISDTVQLLISPVRNWVLRGLEKQDVRQHSELVCKLSLFLTYATVHFSSWILVAVTVERFISVFWPHRVRDGCTRRTASVAAIILLGVFTALNSHIFYGHGVSDLPQYYGAGFCEPLYATYSVFWYKTWTWIDVVVAFAAPFLILVVCNSMIIYKLWKTQVKIRKMTVIASTGMRSYAKDKRNVTRTLVLLSFVFMICLTPLQVYLIVIPYVREEADKLLCSDFWTFYDYYTLDYLAFAIVGVVSYINAGFNFFLYVLSGKRFRSEVKALLMCRKSGRNGVFGNSNTTSTRRLTQTTTSRCTNGVQSIHKSSSNGGVDNRGFKIDNMENIDPNLDSTDQNNEGANRISDMTYTIKIEERRLNKMNEPTSLTGVDLIL